jgi:hypothetical protein
VELLDDLATFVVILRPGVDQRGAEKDEVALLPVLPSEWVKRVSAAALLDQVPLQLGWLRILCSLNHLLRRQLDL